MKLFLCVIEQTVTDFLHILDTVVVGFDGSLSTLPPGGRLRQLRFRLESEMTNALRRSIMGKYVVGWILGVPVVVLVIIYMLFN